MLGLLPIKRLSNSLEVFGRLRVNAPRSQCMRLSAKFGGMLSAHLSASAGMCFATAGALPIALRRLRPLRLWPHVRMRRPMRSSVQRAHLNRATVRPQVHWGGLERATNFGTNLGRRARPVGRCTHCAQLMLATTALKNTLH